MNYIKKIFCLITILFLISGCSMPLMDPPLPSTKGDLAIKACMKELTSTQNWTGIITFSRGNYQFTKSLSIKDGKVNTILEVPVGTYNITIVLIDGQENPSFQDTKEDITIFPDKPTNVDFHLRPADGLIEVTIDLKDHPQADQIMRVRVHFDDIVEELTRESPDEALIGEYILTPKSYNFKAALYSDSFRASDKIDPGTWKTIDIKPSSEITITWTPIIESLNITADFYLIPEAPPDFSAEIIDEQVYLQWLPSPSHDTLGYNLYWQPNPFEPFELLDTVAPDIYSYSHKIAENFPEQMINYSIAAFSAYTVGYNSKVASIKLD